MVQVLVAIKMPRYIYCLASLTAAWLSPHSCWGQVATANAAPIVAESALIRVIDQISIPARVPGVLATVEVDEGALVKQGDLLAKVDDAEEELIYQRAVIEYELAQSQAANDVAIRAAQKAMEFARQEYQRLNRASEGIPGSVSKSELEESRVNAEQAELELEKAEHEHNLEMLNERLKLTEQSVAHHNKKIHEILAPLNGMVVEVMRRPGEWVEPGEDVLRVIRIDRLRAEGLVPFEAVTPELVGSPAEITVAIPGRDDLFASGHVVFVNPELNPVNGRVRVRAEFDNPQGLLMPGMRAKLVIHPAAAAMMSLDARPPAKGKPYESTP
jgi:macrolide-specific efflux system membrane fusion protein